MLGSLYCNLMMSMHAVSDADDISCCLLEPPQKKRAVALPSRQSPCDRRQTRSPLPGLDLSKCFFCQKRARKKNKRKREELIRCTWECMLFTLVNEARIRQDQRVLLEAEHADLHAKDVQYHSSCYTKFTCPKQLN